MVSLCFLLNKYIKQWSIEDKTPKEFLIN
jgi:hypothetical protein